MPLGTIVFGSPLGSWASAPAGHGCPRPDACFSRILSALPEVLGRDIRANDPRMSAGYPSQKLILWADFSSEGREWEVGSVVVEFGVFGAPQFSLRRSQNPLKEVFWDVGTENRGAPKRQIQPRRIQPPILGPLISFLRQAPGNLFSFYFWGVSRLKGPNDFCKGSRRLQHK